MWNRESDVQSETQSKHPTSQPLEPDPATPTLARASAGASRGVSCVGAGIQIEGKVTGDEDLHIDGKIDGSVVLRGQRLTVGRSGKLNSEIWAREIVIYGNLTGPVHASDRVEIKKDGSVTGDISALRISIEDGAYFKGRIEIERTKHPQSEANVPELAGAVKLARS